ncbi:MAG: adenylate/guanylate cyclase domain-containing protein [Acidimicrobiia bacterium]
MALPLAALWLLIARPQLDVSWQHHPSHFWLVIGVAAVNMLLAGRMQRAAAGHGDARLLLVAFAFLTAAGFLFLHALATPDVLVRGGNAGFEIATPIGLALASVFLVASSFDPSADLQAAIVGRAPVVRWALLGIMAVWAVASLASIPPLDRPLTEQADGALAWLAAFAVLGFVVTAVRYFVLHRRRPAVMLVAIITASVLLAEAMVTMVFARNWHLSWWTWHVLMTAAFGFVAYSAYVQYRREGSAAGLFNAVTTEHTAARLREEYGSALESLTGALERSETSELTEVELDLITAGLAARFDLTERQVEVLRRAAGALAAERDQARRLEALARVGAEAQIGVGEEALLERIVGVVAESFGRDVMRIGLERSGGLEYSEAMATGPWPDASAVERAPLEIRGSQVGTVEFARLEGSFDERDRALVRTLAAEVAISLDNTRLYAQLDTLFRQYLSPDVADTLIADPSQAALGGAVVEVTALFADLRGFTAYSERSSPEGIVAMLNRYFGLAVPVILGSGGTVVQFQGDAVLAIFNAPSRQADHRLRAVQAGLGMQTAIEEVATANPDFPRFRVGINTGPALVGNVGSDEFRSFNVMGDAVNVAARLEAIAEPGTVVVGAATYRPIAESVEVEPLGDLALKGKEEPVEAYVVRRVR